MNAAGKVDPSAQSAAQAEDRSADNSAGKPDIMAQLREIWGDRMFTEEQVREMREMREAESDNLLCD